MKKTKIKAGSIKGWALINNRLLYLTKYNTTSTMAECFHPFNVYKTRTEAREASKGFAVKIVPVLLSFKPNKKHG